ncbi:OmpH family outer membrane protein [Sphingomonas sp. SUN039]|uniref:OmpH family outer membrane protein n=1 Tax=Sphingomonas sp. SUN039 TaxID=2937787 RepID=UPI002164EA29|nr:OmpH family outer membrane protein [Sphingomonas sp. SUN039]UVO53282.1 OmpH family outer membrane protein [Sphingomonas sp. SUN039]
MKNILIAASLAAIVLGTAPASAQSRAPATMMIVVDTGKIFAECTACKAAQAALKVQADAIQARQQALATPLQTEGQAIQAAVNALNGKEPDAALKARATAFQTRQQDAQKELAGREETFNRNRAYVGQQVSAKLNPIIVATMKVRGANVAVDPNPQIILAYEPALDATNDVLAQLNAQLPSVSTIAPAAPATPAAAPGR